MALTQEEKQQRAEERRQKKWNETHKIVNGVDYKICNICLEWKPSTNEYFHKTKNNIDGLQPYCKVCASAKYLKWVNENRERKRERDREWVKKPENVPKVRKNQKIYIESGKRAEWDSKNKERLSGYSHDKRVNGTHTISDIEWKNCKTYFNNSCAYCGLSEADQMSNFNQRLHMEHADPSGLNDLSNCIPACKSCNSRKWKYEMDEWYNTSNLNFNIERRKRIKTWLNTDYQLYIEAAKNF